jgi:hypothetical protein
MNVAPADLSWVGHVIDLPGGRVQVKWGDGSISKVCVYYTPIYMVGDVIKSYILGLSELINWWKTQQ